LLPVNVGFLRRGHIGGVDRNSGEAIKLT